MLLRNAALAAFLVACGWCGDGAQDAPLAALARHAEAFREKARRLVSEETLVQRSYRLPPHSHFAIGPAAETLHAYFMVHEIVSAYSVGSLKGDASGNLVEMREIVGKDGAAVATPAAALKALQADVSAGEDRIRKKILAEFTGLGLVDVATDYGLILLAFTGRGAATLKIEPAGAAWVGTEEALVFDWVQTGGGALEFRGRKTTRRPMSGRIWLRRSDSMPLRITASFQHPEGDRQLEDDASVDYTVAAGGCPVPATVVHRHFVDNQLLTENLYAYSQFRLFSADTTIRYDSPETRQK